MEPFEVYSRFAVEPVRGEGLYLWDRQGRKYLDMYGGHAVISIGHSHPHYRARIREQTEKLGFYSNAVENSLQKELADKLGRLSGYQEYQLFLCNSGAEANENALKLASFHTGRKNVISFTGGFHGRTSAAVALTDHPDIRAPINETANAIILPFNEIEPVKQTFEGHEIAAVLIEGIQGIAGIREPDPEFLRTLRDLCNRYGALLICDEIQSGYGRTGEFFAHQHYDVEADIITTGKGMGNGFPLAGVLITPDITPVPGMLGTTFGGNHLACAAGIAVLEILQKEDLLARARDSGEYLFQQVQALTMPLETVRGKGLMIGMQFGFDCAELRTHLVKKHHVFTGSSSQPQTLRLMPPLTLDRDTVEYFVKHLAQAVDEIA